MAFTYTEAQPSYTSCITLSHAHTLATGSLQQAERLLQPFDLVSQLIARHRLPGRLGSMQHTIDPNVRRCPLILAGRVWALIYINLHHRCYSVIRRSQDSTV